MPLNISQLGRPSFDVPLVSDALSRSPVIAQMFSGGSLTISRGVLGAAGSVGAAAGAATASGEGASIAAGDGASTGAGGASGAGGIAGNVEEGDGASAGGSGASGAGEATAEGDGASDGAASASAVPASATPVLSNLNLDFVTGAISLDVDIPCRLYANRYAPATGASAAAIIAGTGGGLEVIGPFDLTAGANAISHNFAAGLDADFQIAFAARVEPSGPPSNALYATGNIDTIQGVFLTGNPADDATGVAVDGNIILDMSDDVAATGTVTLRLVGGAAVEVFNLATGLGDNGGTITRSANVRTTDRLTLDPGANMAGSTAHAVRTSSLEDEAENPFIEVTDDTTYNFTTAASGPLEFFQQRDVLVTNNGTTGQYQLPSISRPAGEYYVFLQTVKQPDAGESHTSFALNGQPATKINGTDANSGGDVIVSGWRVTLGSAGAGLAVAQISGDVDECVITVFAAPTGSTVQDQGPLNGNPFTFNGTLPGNGRLLMASVCTQNGAMSIAWTGDVDRVSDPDIDTGAAIYSAAESADLTAGAVTGTATATNTFRNIHCAILVNTP